MALQSGEKVRLEERDIRSLAELKLLQPSLYMKQYRNWDDYLFLRANIVGDAYPAEIQYKRNVMNSNAHGGMAITWDKEITGVHFQQGGYILSSFSQLLDDFIVE